MFKILTKTVYIFNAPESEIKIITYFEINKKEPFKTSCNFTKFIINEINIKQCIMK